MKNIFAALALTIFLASVSFAHSFTTWFPKEFECPIDKEKNTFLVIGSYGTYIYTWPSKYQWLFFPQTDSPTFYLCKKCHLATYMWDFEKLPKDKIAEVTKVLATIKVSKNFKDYQEIPVTERLEIMEKIYAVLDKDEDWWETFYRIEGYHYGKAGKAEMANKARSKSLALIDKDLKNEKGETPKKLLLYVSAAMKHFTNDDQGALADLQKALETKYQSKEAKPEEVESAEVGLNERIKEYIEKIKSEKDKPRLFDNREGEGDH
jgi:hypothetical protein